MLKFKDYLTELFDKPVPFILVAKNYEWYKYAFDVNGIKYAVIIESYNGDYQIAFYAKHQESNIATYKFDKEFEGNANKVMSTVIAICIRFFTREVNIDEGGDVKTISYVASDQSKIKTYNAIIKRFLSHFNIPYRYHQVNEDVGRFYLYA